MEKVKRKIEVTQEQYDDLIEAINAYEARAFRLGYECVSNRYEALFNCIENQIEEQGGFEE